MVASACSQKLEKQPRQQAHPHMNQHRQNFSSESSASYIVSPPNWSRWNRKLEQRWGCSRSNLVMTNFTFKRGEKHSFLLEDALCVSSGSLWSTKKTLLKWSPMGPGEELLFCLLFATYGLLLLTCKGTLSGHTQICRGKESKTKSIFWQSPFQKF